MCSPLLQRRASPKQISIGFSLEVDDGHEVRPHEAVEGEMMADIPHTQDYTTDVLVWEVKKELLKMHLIRSGSYEELDPGRRSMTYQYSVDMMAAGCAVSELGESTASNKDAVN